MMSPDEAVKSVLDYMQTYRGGEALPSNRWFFWNRLTYHYNMKGVNEKFVLSYFPLTDDEKTANLPTLPGAGKKRNSRRA